MHENKGFSLIELIVTIAVLSVAASIVIGSLSLVGLQNMRSCTQEINALLARTKICAMSRAGDVYLVLRVDDDGIWADYHEHVGGTDTLAQSDRVGKNTVSASWTDTLGTAHDLSVLPLVLSFDRGTGAFTTLAVSYAMAGRTDCPAGSLLYCAKITLSGGGSARTVELIPQTGKHFITAS